MPQPERMDRIPDKIRAVPADGSYFSLEFFPPKTHLGFANLHGRLERMARALRPLFVSVTWGAGGSTSDRSLELAELCQQQLGVTTCLHLTCTNMDPTLVDAALDKAKEIGIRNILALRGDPPAGDELDSEQVPTSRDGEKPASGQYKWAVELVKHIRDRHGDYFSIGVAAYPEGHADEAYPVAQDPERDIPYLVEKVKAGADFILTQLFFDAEAYLKFEHRLRTHESGVFKTIPIIPGLMPIQSYKIMHRTAKLSHAKLPAELSAKVEPVKDDDAAVKDVGIEYFADIISTIQKDSWAASRPSGFHFYTLNLEKVVTQLIEDCDLIPPESPVPATPFDDDGDEEGDNEDALDEHDVLSSDDKFPTTSRSSRDSISDSRRRRLSSMNASTHNRVIVNKPSGRSLRNLEAPQAEAGVLSDGTGTRANTLAISEGEGSLGREATWDDFPNGRWGDSRSPAFGEIDGYGVSLPVSASEALTLWSHPSTEAAISALFTAHITGQLPTLPWSEDAFSSLSAETAVIAPKLRRLNEAGWWTVASQPAVNGARSDDPVFGWGPPKDGGTVFQKAFVEIFVSSDVWARLKGRLDREFEDGETVSYLAAQGRNAGALVTSPDQTSETVVNPVTWGVFPGKEIVTPTIIQPASFAAWVAEAFDLWKAWQRIYRPGSDPARLIDRVRQDRWLVCIIHHEYPHPDKLWDLLVEWAEEKDGEGKGKGEKV